MRTSVHSLAVALALATCAFATHATTPEGWFLQINAGSSNSSYDEGHSEGSRHADRNDFARGELIGYRWGITDTYALGIEGGYTRLGQSESSNINSIPYLPPEYPTCMAGNAWRLSSRAAVFGASMKWNVSAPWTVTAHTGVAHAHATHDQHYVYCGLSRYRHTETTHNGPYAGIGFGYDIAPSITLSLNADMYWVRFEDGFVSGTHTPHIRVLGASAEYRF